jgi:hypothetical protein
VAHHADGFVFTENQSVVVLRTFDGGGDQLDDIIDSNEFVLAVLGLLVVRILEQGFGLSFGLFLILGYLFLLLLHVLIRVAPALVVVVNPVVFHAGAVQINANL